MNPVPVAKQNGDADGDADADADADSDADDDAAERYVADIRYDAHKYGSIDTG